jgi:hypothetical protein
MKIPIIFLECQNPADKAIYNGPVVVRKAARNERHLFVRSRRLRLEDPSVEEAEEPDGVGYRDIDAIVCSRN